MGNQGDSIELIRNVTDCKSYIYYSNFFVAGGLCESCLWNVDFKKCKKLQFGVTSSGKYLKCDSEKNLLTIYEEDKQNEYKKFFDEGK